MTTRNICAPAVVVETTWAALPPTLMVFASSCALSSVRRAANETVNPAEAGFVTGGTTAAAVSCVAGGFVIAPVELADSESFGAPSPGKVTGWSSPCGRGRNPSQAKKYQKSFAPPATVDLTSSFSGSTKVTSFALSRASLPSGVIAGRSVSQRVGTAPTSLFVPIAITQA